MTERTAPGLVASYRIQLRNGFDLDAVAARVAWLRELGISHIYLSPLFHAAAGSTHGYDVIDPNAVDPVLGGEEAFRRLSAAARAAGLGLILDIVPNHMSFTPDNPYLADVMRKGPTSRFARIFDIDWSKGPLHFAVLDRPLAELLDAGEIVIGGLADCPSLGVYQQSYALRPSHLARRLINGEEPLDEMALERLLAEQYWSLGHWRDSANAISHRRFFNISSLVGLRQEDPQVFELTHRWVIEQVRAGCIQGLRVDHIDGLARPGAYLRRLRKAVGFLPIWVEKIVKRGETIPPNWPVEGMSGYEFMTPLTQLLTCPEGLERLRQAAAGSVPDSYPVEVRAVRRYLLQEVFGPELDRVTQAGMAALAAGQGEAAAVRAAIVQLAMHWPVYRSYAGDAQPLDPRFTRTLEAARGDNLPSSALATVLALLSAPDDPMSRAFSTRFEQLTGALTAKSEEDTAFFRSVAYLPFCEVGAEPDLVTIDASQFEAMMRARAAQTPCALTALSTHDTKRSADARAAVIALTYLPDLGSRLYGEARDRALAGGIDARWGIYAVQTALIMYSQPYSAARVTDHIAKAMRESKDGSSYESPAFETEEVVARLACQLIDDLIAGAIWSREDKAAFEQIHCDVVLAQSAFQLTAPGIPDLYQGSEVIDIALTDPDNRRPIEWNRLSDPTDNGDRSKIALTRSLLAMRRGNPELFAMGSYVLEVSEQCWVVTRQWRDERVSVKIDRPHGGLAAAGKAEPSQRRLAPVGS